MLISRLPMRSKRLRLLGKGRDYYVGLSENFASAKQEENTLAFIVKKYGRCSQFLRIFTIFCTIVFARKKEFKQVPKTYKITNFDKVPIKLQLLLSQLTHTTLVNIGSQNPHLQG